MKAFSKRTDEEIYIEYVNDWLTIQAMAENYQISVGLMTDRINKGRKIHLKIPVVIPRISHFEDRLGNKHCISDGMCTINSENGVVVFYADKYHAGEKTRMILKPIYSERKDFEITVRTIELPIDDILWDDHEEVAIYVKNMNRHDDFSEVIKRIKNISEELKN